MAIDPDVKVLLDALEARVEALEQAPSSGPAVHPQRVVEHYPDGTELVYEIV